MTAPDEIVARRLLKQAEWCERLGSSLYSTLLRHAAEDVRAAGVCCAVLHDHYDDPPDSALAVRFLGAVHRLVLEEKAPQLAACYPSAGGDNNCDDLWPRFRDVVKHHEAVLRELVRRPVQTNEVGRCAALLGGFLEVACQTGLPSDFGIAHSAEPALFMPEKAITLTTGNHQRDFGRIEAYDE